MNENQTEKEAVQIRSILLSPDHAGLRLDKALALVLPDLSRATIQRLIKTGQVLQAGHPITRLSEKGRDAVPYDLHIPPPEPSEVMPEPIALDILYEDSDLIVINKAAGMVVHPGAGINRGTLVNALLDHCGHDLSGIGGRIRPGIVHRLDKDTSGILVVAKNDRTHQGLAQQFEAHTATRRYLAITKGVPPHQRGTIDAPIGRHPQNRIKMAVQAKGRRAITHFRVLAPYPPFALIACRLETGRTHQIRVHLAHIGRPLLGDPVYGRPSDPPRQWSQADQETLLGFRRQALHATSLGFQHPGRGEKLLFKVPPPADFLHLLHTLQTATSPHAIRETL